MIEVVVNAGLGKLAGGIVDRDAGVLGEGLRISQFALTQRLAAARIAQNRYSIGADPCSGLISLGAATRKLLKHAISRRGILAIATGGT